MTVETEKTHTKEEKFLGVSTPIETDASTDDDIKVEVVEETEAAPKKAAAPVVEPPAGEDDEHAQYSERVQKRIAKLTYQHKEAERQQHEAESLREEAVRFAQGVLQQNQQYENVIHSGEARLVNQFKTSAALAVDKAREQFRKAHEEGDTDAVMAAQEAAFTAQAALQTANNYDADYQQRSAQFVHHRQQYQPPQVPQTQTPAVRPPTPEATDWAGKNPWFGTDEHRDMTAIAYATHETLIREKGLTADTPEYYAEIDQVIKTRFPEYFEGGDVPVPSQTHNTVVAPASRSTGKKPRRIKLNQRQYALAKRLGITPEQYARSAEKGE